MKKILLLLVSSLLIACMAGSAMAAYIAIDGDIDKPSVVSINPNGIAESSVNLGFRQLENVNSEHVAGVRTECKVQGGKLEAQIINLPTSTASVLTNTAWSVTNGVAATKPYTPGNSAFDCILKVRGTAPGYVIITDTDTGVSQTVQVYIKTEVPEFPTVALPVAGILGLIFIFGRRKEGL